MGLVALSLALARGRLRRFEIAERSMEPALRPGDYVVAVRRSAHPRRGEIVVFEAPGRPGFDTVKRIVGLPGESIDIGGGQVHTDDAVLAEPWADGPTYPDGRWEIGPDEVFVLGDKRAISSGDGRSIGPISNRDTPWRVVWRYWPAARAGRL